VEAQPDEAGSGVQPGEAEAWPGEAGWEAQPDGAGSGARTGEAESEARPGGVGSEACRRRQNEEEPVALVFQRNRYLKALPRFHYQSCQICRDT